MNFADDCNLCEASKDWTHGTYADAELADVAKKHGFSAKQLKIRLGIETGRQKWDEERISRLKTFVAEGLKMTEIAKEFGVSVPRINQLVKENRIDTQAGKTARVQQKIVQASLNTEAVLAEYRANPELSVSQLSAQSQIPEKTVLKILRAHNLPINNGGEVHEVNSYVETDDTVSIPLEERVFDQVGVAMAVVDYMDEAGDEISMEKYLEWATNQEDAPNSKELRAAFGSWANAKKAAEELITKSSG